jgi:excisionase family DNA binding protein
MLALTIEKHFTIKQVAAALQLSDRTIRRWIKSGKLYAVEYSGRFGSEYRIPRSALTALGFRVSDEEAPHDPTRD